MARGDVRSKGSSAPAEMDVYTGLSVVAFVAMLTALLLLIFAGLMPYRII